MKNVLVLKGSPRRGGNSDLLADAFVSGAKEAGHHVTEFPAGRKQIKGCLGCKQCYSKENRACVVEDDFGELVELYQNSDIIVYATPLYWYSFPSQLKAAMDKMYALVIGRREMALKESVLLACCEDTDPEAFNGILRSYELICGFRKWRDLGRVLAFGVDEPGDILNQPDILKRAKELGLSLSCKHPL